MIIMCQVCEAVAVSCCTGHGVWLRRVQCPVEEIRNKNPDRITVEYDKGSLALSLPRPYCLEFGGYVITEWINKWMRKSPQDGCLIQNPRLLVRNERPEDLKKGQELARQKGMGFCSWGSSIWWNMRALGELKPLNLPIMDHFWQQYHMVQPNS